MLLASCGKVREKAKETINKGGETVGKTATEFFEGISAGIDKNGLETGRAKIDIAGKADEAAYFDFVFDKRTYIEVKSKIILE